jgi:2-oxoglutarate dehydrogenase E1 component
MTQNQSVNTSFLNSVNAEYIAHLYAQYQKSSSSVDESWREFFDGLSDSDLTVLREMHGASWTPNENRMDGRGFAATQAAGQATQQPMQMAQAQPFVPFQAPSSGGDIQSAVKDSIRAIQLIRAYRVRGHLVADLDPLDMRPQDIHPELDPGHYGFAPKDYDRAIRLDGVLGMEEANLNEIMKALKATYCDKIGVEFMHLSDPEEKAWVQQRIEEPRNHTDFTTNGKRAILERLTAAESFEQFLAKKYPGTKKFGLDGGEVLIPAIEQIMKRGGQLGLKEMVVGMAHRGRLNVLANVMGKPFSAIFAEFLGKKTTPDDILGSGDVKYHLGTSSDRDFDGNNIHLSLTANPSHLECVSPVVIGKVRAKQYQRADGDGTQVMPILLHGDAAFAGQGIVAETLMISELDGYSVGGTMHVVINNQIGFTTMPQYSRSGPYCTDVAKLLSAPIFHVNGDDPEAVVHVARIATEFRQKFNKDVVIDIICYRRFGHNEGDEPSFTQPLMYKQIRNLDSTRQLYAKQLEGEGVLKADEAKAIDDEMNDKLQESFDAANNYKPNSADFLQGMWRDMAVAEDEKNARRGATALDDKTFKSVGKALTTIPEDFNIHSKLKRFIDARKKMFDSGEGFDWSTAEALAFGSLVKDGYGVRLSGQDCGRGTFSQRHAKMYDQSDAHIYQPLQNVDAKQAPFEVHDSPLSEFAVLGFEYGFSLAEPRWLTLWEAQFGDFVNGAQTIIDQFISSGESKWLRMSGLVMLLPHGYEGQGPEHSSCHPERFLSMSAEDNWQIVNATTPANYFHVLRRQMVRNFRKPLIMFTPKSLLRHKLCVSDVAMMTGDSTFHRILWDDAEIAGNLNKPKDIKRVVLCTGKVYFDMYQAREDAGVKDVAILRLEQLYPFPHNALMDELKKYPNADVVWCQEEPENYGYWQFTDRRIEGALTELKHKAKRPSYVGRAAAASPATGNAGTHKAEQERLINEALKIKTKK